MKQIKNDAEPADTDVWLEAVKDIKKLPEAEAKPQAPLIIDEIEARVNYADAYSGNCLEPLKTGELPNIDRRTADRFKRGEMPIERRLDLHGYKETEAYAEVCKFIKDAYLAGCRNVLIITGKGLKRETDDIFETKGIIKERVPQWLNTQELRPLILGINYALPKDGGEGALYVLLRRQAKTKRLFS